MSKKILKIIDEGGDQLQHDVANLLNKNGWISQIAPYYKDIATDKSREIDVVARKEFIVKDNFWGRREEKILLRLFIECKYIKHENLFYFSKKDIDKATKFAKDNRLLRHEEYADISTNHYVKDEEVAKTWKSVEGRDDIYDAWTQSVHAMIYFQKHSPDRHSYIIDMPIVILKDFGNLYKKEKAEKDFSEIKSNFQLEVDYSYSLSPEENISKTFFVDIISFETIENFLKIIEESDILILKKNLAEVIFKEGHSANQRRMDGEDVNFFR